MPLLRRLQAKIQRATSLSYSVEHYDKKTGLKNDGRTYTRMLHLREQFERLRILLELVKKRERSKRDLLSVNEEIFELQFYPLKRLMRQLLSAFQGFDKQGIFLEPVNPVTAPGYLDVIKHPMDFTSMKTKLLNDEYESIDQFKVDFNTLCQNAMLYNEANTIYYKEAQRLSKFGNDLIDIKISEFDAEKQSVIEKTKEKGNESETESEEGNDVERQKEKALISYDTTKKKENISCAA